eukprot:TRINITY_DN4176_c0_g1_i6.p2 TRINITY_DN4176_c0_g1~~TRINITY_DN4176_c0_g1_i6.p2  ORF type:complete len:130 (-),score=28.65 TRINITY_DN4176_c0_g1_i6:4-393(-)
MPCVTFIWLLILFFFQMIRRPPRSTLSSSSAASDVYKRQIHNSDLVIIMGTSLSVFPVAGMIYDIKKGTPVMVVNQELPRIVNGIEEKDLAFVEGNIEESIKKMAKDLNWKEFLERVQVKSLQLSLIHI